MQQSQKIAILSTLILSVLVAGAMYYVYLTYMSSIALAPAILNEDAQSKANVLDPTDRLWSLEFPVRTPEEVQATQARLESAHTDEQLSAAERDVIEVRLQSAME